MQKNEYQDKSINSSLVNQDVNIVKWSPSVIGDTSQKKVQTLAEFVKIMLEDLSKGLTPEAWLSELLTSGRISLAKRLLPFIGYGVSEAMKLSVKSNTEEWEHKFNLEMRNTKKRLERASTLLDSRDVNDIEELLFEADNLQSLEDYHHAFNYVKEAGDFLDSFLQEKKEELAELANQAIERIGHTLRIVHASQEILRELGTLEFVHEFMEYANRLMLSSDIDLNEVYKLCDAIESLCTGDAVDETLLAGYRVQFHRIINRTQQSQDESHKLDISSHISQPKLISSVISDRARSFLQKISNDYAIILDYDLRQISHVKPVPNEEKASELSNSLRRFIISEQPEEYLEVIGGLLNYWSNRKTTPSALERDLQSYIASYLELRVNSLVDADSISTACQVYASRIALYLVMYPGTFDEHLETLLANLLVLWTLKTFNADKNSGRRKSLQKKTFEFAIQQCLKDNLSQMELAERSYNINICLVYLATVKVEFFDIIVRKLRQLDENIISRLNIGMLRLQKSMNYGEKDGESIIDGYQHFVEKFVDMQSKISKHLQGLVESTTSITQLANFPAEVNKLSSVIPPYFYSEFTKILQILSNISQHLTYYLTPSLPFPEKRDVLDRLLTSEIPSLQTLLSKTPSDFVIRYMISVASNLEVICEAQRKEITQQSAPDIYPDFEHANYRFDNNIYCDIEFVNYGQTPAFDIQFWVGDANYDEYKIIDKGNQVMPVLYPGKEQRLSKQVRVRPLQVAKETGIFTLYLHVQYRSTDRSQPIKRFFQLRVTLPTEQDKFVPRKNPYFVGGTLEDGEMFFGRATLMHRLLEIVGAPAKPGAAVIVGQKRSGKTSLMMQLSQRLPATVIAILFDIPQIVSKLPRREISTTSSVEEVERFIAHFLFALYRAVVTTCLEKYREVDVPGLTYEDLMLPPGPTYNFGEFLHQFNTKNPDYRLLYMFDEFGDLMGGDQIDFIVMKSIKSWIDRKLLSCIVCGLNEFYDTVKKYANQIAMSEPLMVDYLDYEDAQSLIIKPVINLYRAQGVEMETYIIPAGVEEEIIRITDGSPFYIQIFCKSLVVFMQKMNISSVTASDIRKVWQHLVNDLREINVDEKVSLITAIENANFENLCAFLDTQPDPEWSRRQSLECLIIRLIASETINKQYVSLETLHKYVQETVAIREVSTTIEILVRRGTIKRSKSDPDNVMIRVPLFRDWLVIKYPTDTNSIRRFLRDLPEE